MVSFHNEKPLPPTTLGVFSWGKTPAFGQVVQWMDQILHEQDFLLHSICQGSDEKVAKKNVSTFL